MRQPTDRRALLRAIFLSALRSIVLVVLGPKAGQVAITLARTLLGANENDGGTHDAP